MKKLTGIIDFLGDDNPCDYDFKDLMKEYYNYYKNNHLNENEYVDMLYELEKMEGKCPVDKWFDYKTLDENIDKKIRRFDCDSWNDTCELTSQIYNKLWNCLRGGDTMNSFATILNTYTGFKSFRESKEKYDNGELEKVFGRYALSISTIGNFGLVPYGFNRYRGKSNFLEDYWDKSLYYLQQTAKDAQWLSVGQFPKYINYLFLWDYVVKSNKDNDYFVKDIFSNEFISSHCDTLNNYNKRTTSKDGIKILIKNAQWAIKRRGIFMTAMLRILCEHGDDGKTFYKKLQDEIFSSGNCYNGYQEVFKRIEGIEGYESFNAIISKAQEDINNVKINEK